jgi:hypothetical protein
MVVKIATTMVAIEPAIARIRLKPATPAAFPSSLSNSFSLFLAFLIAAANSSAPKFFIF